MNEILTSAEVQAFSSANQAAMLLMNRGAMDYVGARCCLLNHVFSGFELSSQAVEKHLKAMLLFNSPGDNVRGYSHKVTELAAAAQSAGLVDLSAHQETISRLHGHYQARYPDNPGQLPTSSTAEIVEIDLLLDQIIAAIPIPSDVLIRTGVYVRALMMIERPELPWSETAWLLQGNMPLVARLPSLAERLHRWTAFNHPRIPAS